MGDTGSLALGGAMAGLAITTRTDVLLLLLGGLFVVITTSVILQVASFKLTGRRVFLMAPLQHHFELRGWGEVTIVIRFWIIAGLCVGLGLGVFYAEWVSGGTALVRAPLGGRSVVVAGLGVSGFAAADALLRLGARVTVVDSRTGADGDALGERADVLDVLGADVRLGEGAAATPRRGTDLVVTSPGWRPDVAAAAGRGRRGGPGVGRGRRSPGGCGPPSPRRPGCS